MQVTPDDIVPVLALHHGRRTDAVVHAFVDGLGIVYATLDAPDSPLGRADLRALRLDERGLHGVAFGNLHAMIDTAALHGSPPALMASFHGIESSLVLADAFWDELAPDLPGSPVVAVPARDVLVITGSGSAAGVAKAQRTVERIQFAHPHNALIPDLLERRGNRWYPLDLSPQALDEEPTGTWDDQYAESFEHWSPPEDRTVPRRERPDAPPVFERDGRAHYA